MAQPGIIPLTSIPGWPTPIAGIRENLDFVLRDNAIAQSAIRPDGLFVGDVPLAQNFLTTYPGSALQLAWAQKLKQEALDKAFDTNFDLAKFIRGGTATGITGTNVGNFLATITNNYRTLRASIANAANVAAVNAINISSGWPSNP